MVEKIYRLKIFVFVLLYAFVFIQLYGMYDDTRDIAYRTALLRGDFTGMPISNLFLYFIGLAKPLSFLLSFLPKVPWVGGLLVFLHLFAVGVGVKILVLKLKTNGIGWGGQLFVATLFVFLVFSEALFYLSIACSCMISAAAAVIYLYFIAPGVKNKWLKEIAQFISWLCLVVAVLIQNEVTLVALISVFLFLFLCGNNLWKATNLLVRVAALYGVVYFVIYFTGGNSQKEFLTNESYFFTYYDTYLSKKEPVLSASDSVKQECMQQWFVWDKEQFAPAYLKTITSKQPIAGIEKNQILFKTNMYLQGLKDGVCNRLLPVCALNLLLLLAAIGLTCTERNKMMGFVLYKLLLALFFSVICILLKFEFRLFHSVVIIDTLLSFVFVVGCTHSVTNKRPVVFTTVNFGVLLLLVLGCTWKHTYYKQSNQEQKTAIYESAKLRHEIDSMFQNQILVPGLESTLTLVNNSPLQTEHLTSNNTVLGYDAGYTTYYREFETWLLINCGGVSFRSFVKYLWHNNQRVVIIASEEKISLWQRYLRIVYNTQVSFIKISDASYTNIKQNNYNHKSLAYYRINTFEESLSKP